MDESWLEVVDAGRAIAKYQVEVSAGCLLAIALMVSDTKTLLSYCIPIGVWVVANFMMRSITPVYLELSESGHTSIIRHVWYLTWVVFNCVSILVIASIHDRLKIKFNYLSYIVVAEFATLSIIQIIRYAERFVFETSYSVLLYRYGIWGIEILTALIFVCATLIVYSKKS